MQPSFALLQTSLQTRSGTTSENAILEKVDVVYQKKRTFDPICSICYIMVVKVILLSKGGLDKHESAIRRDYSFSE